MIDPTNEGPTTVTIPAGAPSVALTIPTTDDTTAEDASVLTITTQTSAGYTLDRFGSTRTITILDDDTAAGRVDLAMSSWDLTEGAAAGFLVTRSGPPTATLTVHLTVTETGDMIDPTNEGPTTVVIPAGANTALLAIPTTDDTTTETNSTVTATITSGAGYTLGAPQSLSATIYDNETKPTVIIAPSSTANTPTEGDTIGLIITRSGPATTDLTVHLNITETGDMIDPTNEGPTTVTIYAGTNKTNLSVPTTDDNTPETNSTITATITPNTNYTTGTSNTLNTTIHDNDQ